MLTFKPGVLSNPNANILFGRLRLLSRLCTQPINRDVHTQTWRKWLPDPVLLGIGGLCPGKRKDLVHARPKSLTPLRRLFILSLVVQDHSTNSTVQLDSFTTTE